MKRVAVAPLGLVVLAAPVAAEAQQAGKVYRRGLLSETGVSTPGLKGDTVMKLKTAKALSLNHPAVGAAAGG